MSSCWRLCSSTPGNITAQEASASQGRSGPTHLVQPTRFPTSALSGSSTACCRRDDGHFVRLDSNVQCPPCEGGGAPNWNTACPGGQIHLGAPSAPASERPLIGRRRCHASSLPSLAVLTPLRCPQVDEHPTPVRAPGRNPAGARISCACPTRCQSSQCLERDCFTAQPSGSYRSKAGTEPSCLQARGEDPSTAEQLDRVQGGLGPLAFRLQLANSTSWTSPAHHRLTFRRRLPCNCVGDQA